MAAQVGAGSCCDLCLGSDLGAYRVPSAAGRRLVVCRTCGLVAAVGAIDGAEAERTIDRDQRSDARRAAAVMRLISSGKVLEVGCGAGQALACLTPSKYEAVGVEPNPDLAQAAGARLKEAGLKGAILNSGLAEARLPAETFDLVALFGTLHTYSSPRAIFMEVSRLLKDGGYVVIETPSLSSLTARLWGSRWHPLRDPAADYLFTQPALERLASVCGVAAGTVLPPVPAGWPAPGMLVMVGRKSSVSVKAPGLASLAGQVRKMAPMGATE